MKTSNFTRRSVTNSVGNLRAIGRCWGLDASDAPQIACLSHENQGECALDAVSKPGASDLAAFLDEPFEVGEFALRTGRRRLGSKLEAGGGHVGNYNRNGIRLATRKPRAGSLALIRLALPAALVVLFADDPEGSVGNL